MLSLQTSLLIATSSSSNPSILATDFYMRVLPDRAANTTGNEITVRELKDKISTAKAALNAAKCNMADQDFGVAYYMGAQTEIREYGYGNDELPNSSFFGIFNHEHCAAIELATKTLHDCICRHNKFADHPGIAVGEEFKKFYAVSNVAGIIALIKNQRIFVAGCGKPRNLIKHDCFLFLEREEPSTDNNIFLKQFDLVPENKFMILTSKGIWNAFSQAANAIVNNNLNTEAKKIKEDLCYNTACAVVKEALNRHKSCKIAATSLVNCANIHGGTDNMTAIVVDLRKYKQPNTTPQPRPLAPQILINPEGQAKNMIKRKMSADESKESDAKKALIRDEDSDHSDID